MHSQHLSLLRRGLLLSLSVAAALNIASCSKTTNADDAKKFVGTWKGVSNCAGVVSNTSGAMVIDAGSDGVTATLPLTAGIGSCLKASKITGTAKEDILTFPKQTVSDACGKSYQVTGLATIIGDSISITVNAVGDSSGICNFRGKK